MRILEKEKTAYSRLREVSELRTQFQCEYRFFLDQQNSRNPSPAAIRGEMLHSRIAVVKEEKGQTYNRLVPIVIAIAAIIIGIIWILG